MLPEAWGEESMNSSNSLSPYQPRFRARSLRSGSLLRRETEAKTVMHGSRMVAGTAVKYLL